MIFLRAPNEKEISRRHLHIKFIMAASIEQVPSETRGMRKVSSGVVVFVHAVVCGMRRLIWVFAVRIYPKTRFCLARSIYSATKTFQVNLR